MRAPQSNPRSPHDVATARMYQRRKQLGLRRGVSGEACASALGSPVGKTTFSDDSFTQCHAYQTKVLYF